MTDTVDQATRSRVMSWVRSKNTKPELALRRLVYSMGYRYRLYGAKLPGRPDLVFGGRKKVIFAHGCFWHQHEGCPRAFKPKSRVEVWSAKLAGNRARDSRIIEALEAAGWGVLVVWECEVDCPDTERRMVDFLGPSRRLPARP